MTTLVDPIPATVEEMTEEHHHLHKHKVKAFELFAAAAQQEYPDTEGVDPGPWYFWFKAAEALENQAPDDAAKSQ